MGMNSRALLVGLLGLGTAGVAQAHKTWLLPSETVLSKEGWITVDAAVSNDLFYFNHVPLRLENLAITAPDGAKLEPQNAATGKYRSSFDVQLARPGTYRIAIVSDSLLANYEDNGANKRWRGDAARFAKEVPANAAKLQVTQSQGRIESFVTVGSPSIDALKPSGKGLELQPITHPNDLFAGEAARFGFLIDGSPAANLKVTIIPGGSRYRNAQQEVQLTTDAKGELAVTWPAAGMYWLEATLSDDKAVIPQSKQRRASYVATFEVLQQ